MTSSIDKSKYKTDDSSIFYGPINHKMLLYAAPIQNPSDMKAAIDATNIEIDKRLQKCEERFNELEKNVYRIECRLLEEIQRVEDRKRKAGQSAAEEAEQARKKRRIENNSLVQRHLSKYGITLNESPRRTRWR